MDNERIEMPQVAPLDEDDRTMLHAMATAMEAVAWLIHSYEETVAALETRVMVLEADLDIAEERAEQEAVP
jgi:hypothetical protein